MAESKSVSETTEKWGRVTPGRTEDFKKGIENPRKDWAAETGASDINYFTGVQNAQAKGSFKKGVIKAGTKTWKENTLKKGIGRFAEGVSVSLEAYQKGIAPYLEAIKGVILPPRFPRRDPRNIARVSKVNEALVAKKLSLLG